jgi:hypothetical protein
MSRPKSNVAGHHECAVDLVEGAWYYDREPRELFKLQENRITFKPKNTRFEGTLTIETPDGGVHTY